MSVETKRILLAMANSPNPQDIKAAVEALDRDATVVQPLKGVAPSELANTWAGRRAGPFLSEDMHSVVDALLAALATSGQDLWMLHQIRSETASFVVFVDGKGMGRACIKLTK